jgi:aminoglycoside 3-N-acetyltransferase
MATSTPTVTRDKISSDLQELGIAPGDILLVHSSLSALGWVEGGAETAIDALLDVLGGKGTLLMPSFPRGGEHQLIRNGFIFDVRSAASEMGAISETFRRRSGAVRSLHPTHSVAALGARTEELLSGHECCVTSCGHGTPFGKLAAAGGKILLLGCTHASNTTLHYVENTCGAPTLSRELFHPIVVTPEGRHCVVPTHPHMPGLRRQYERVERELVESGVQRNGKVGNAEARLINAREMVRTIGADIRKDPLYLIVPFTPADAAGEAGD